MTMQDESLRSRDVHERCGLEASLQEMIFDELDAPITRVAALDVPLPYNLKLEAKAVPNPDKITAAVRSLF